MSPRQQAPARWTLSGRVLGLGLGLAVWAAAAIQPAGAQDHPNVDRGFMPGRAYAIGDIDNINLFNGNLVVTIPIGATYRVGGRLSYALTLVYNSNLWDFQQRDDPNGITYTQALPTRNSNAGLGWRLSLGTLYPSGLPVVPTPPNSTDHFFVDLTNRPVYVGPDGADHRFYPSLHHGEQQTQNVLYTRDGSYLRLRPNNPGWLVESEDGIQRQFDASGQLKKIVDPFNNNWVTICDSNIPPCSAPSAFSTNWYINDSQNRSQHVTLHSEPSYPGTVDHVTLQAFGGAFATYTFQYLDTTMPRTCLSTDPALASNVTVPLLTGVTLPNGSSFKVPTAPSLQYITSASPDCRSTGLLERLQLPTLGMLAWTYQSYIFAAESPGKPFPFFLSSQGVATRSTLEAHGNVLGTSTYQSQLVTYPNSRDGKNQTTSVTDPNNRIRVYHFNADSHDGSWPYRYGLPFNNLVTDGAGRFLSEEVYKSQGLLVSTTYVRYEQDQVDSPGVASDVNSGLSDQTALNGREASRRTIYHDFYNADPDVNADTDRSSFDGLGHYRQTVEGGSFPSSPVRSTFRDFNPAANVYNDAGGAGSNFLPPAPTAPWVLGNFDYESKSEGASNSFVQLCVDPATGFVSRKRTLVNGLSQGANDVLVFTPPDGNGNVSEEHYYGGDIQALPVANPPTQTDICQQSLPAFDEFGINHSYSYGTLAQSFYTFIANPFLTVDRVIDSTGLVAVEKDTATVPTHFYYDTMGRLTNVQQRDGSWTQYNYYDPPVEPYQAEVETLNQTNGATANLAQSRIYFDPFGRVSLEWRLMPDGTWNQRSTAYDGAGELSVQSETAVLATNFQAGSTIFWNHDPWARPRRITPPDGHAHDIVFNYHGVRRTERFVSVHIYDCVNHTVGDPTVVSNEIYDRFGRLISVVENSGDCGAQVTTNYAYDVGDRLTQVSTSTTVNGVPTNQTRSFNYDSLGFLRSETHPEKGASGNGTVFYSNYDAVGKVGRKQDGPNDLSYIYDRAEHLIQVNETNVRLLKTFSYSGGNGAGDWSNGKLKTSTRYNYPQLGSTVYTVAISQTYTYGGLDGRVSNRVTQNSVNNSSIPEIWSTTFTYDPLGKLQTVSYPACQFDKCISDGATQARTVTNLYSQGLLTGVAGYANTIAYYPNLMVSLVAHADGYNETAQNDPNSMRRPAAICSQNPALPSGPGSGYGWCSGAYSYDGAGNVTQIGGSSFVYDPVSRLIQSSVSIGRYGEGSPSTQNYQYDAFGNIQAITGTSARNPQTDPATNHLTAGTYDGAGNQTSYGGGAFYGYDAFNLLKSMDNGDQHWLYMYDADDERLWSFQPGVAGQSGRFDRWTLRGLDGKVLRTFEGYYYSFHIRSDYIYRDGLLLASEQLYYTAHFHLDHLGTPRLVTTGGQTYAFHAYYPFGEEATPPRTDLERMKFTGHERDLADPNSPAADLDYMHARHCSPTLARFLSVDRLQGKPSKPQSWNRYSYTLGNPLRHFDPNGRAVVDVQFRAFIPQDWVGIFRGDNRGFSAAHDASARTSITVRVETDPGKRVGQSPLLGKPDVSIGRSHLRFGASDRTGTGPVLPHATASYDMSGNTVIKIQQDVKVPYPTPTGGITADLSVTIPKSASSIAINGSISGSPSFEANVSVDGGPTQNIPLQKSSDDLFLFSLQLQSTTELNLLMPLAAQAPQPQ
ncbi:MAG TPA: RHS repeat-associated core domain-containing protein [Thermoanaerobaculia bacterium]|nr:RHS repeat-associated core domain-containing protein [Thermoanaerobaculia bacterium]